MVALKAMKGKRLMDFIVAGIIGVGLMLYLCYALFNPEKF